MKSEMLTACATLVLATTAALAADWQALTSPTELRALYSDKTFKGTDYLGRPFIGHYRSDGRGILTSDGSTFPRTWEISGDDQVCVSGAMGKTCYRLERDRSDPASIRAKAVGNDSQVIHFRVEDGIPKF